MPFEQRTCLECGVEFRFMAAPSSLKKGEGKFCSTSCSTTFNRTGKRSNNWRGGRSTAGGGRYIKVYAPWHIEAQAGGYVLEHRLVMEAKIGRPVGSEEVVHHINGDTKDNRPDNLELLTGQSAHMKLHYRDHRWRSVCPAS